MGYGELAQELKLQGRIFGIVRVNAHDIDDKPVAGCVYKVFDKVMAGETVYLTQKNVGCRGSRTGLGFTDGLPPIPGGFGNFITTGRGEGFPAGERLKCSPEVGEQMILCQPQGVMGDFTAIKIELFDEKACYDLVTVLATPDQLSALSILFNYRRSDYDTVILPVVSGCAQIFRIPFGEMRRQSPRAVIGNTDVFSRPHLPKELLNFTVTAADFRNMCEDTAVCFLHAPMWNGIKQRL